MRATSIIIGQYAPGNPGQISTVQDLLRFVQDENNKIAAFMNLVRDGYQEEVFIAPAKPRNGMIRYADGTQWNPGSGRGMYYYDGNAAVWKFLG